MGARHRSSAIAGMVAASMVGCLTSNPRYQAGEDDDTTGPGVETTTMTTSLTSTTSTASTTDDRTTTATGEDLGDTSLTTSGASTVGSDSDESATGVDPMGCSAFDPMSCPAGQGCKPVPSPYDADSTLCTPLIRSPSPAWEVCADRPGAPGPDGCDAGLVCYTAEEPDLGICTPLCQGDLVQPFCDHSGTRCELFFDGLFGLCLPSCHPLGADCDDGEGCYAGILGMLGGERQITLSCELDESAEMGAQGDACEQVNECDPGLTCVGADLLVNCPGQACCTAFCNVGIGGACPVGLTCVSLWDPASPAAPPSLVDVGLCVLP